jgi:methyltransferase-like protein
MACSLPASQFLGVELSAREVADGQATVDALGLKNVEIRQLDILGVTEQFGTFDYIIAHGVYSWVPDHVREKLLQVCRENLAPDGVAYVSYNTYPGWNFRGMVRDMMRYHSGDTVAPLERVARARGLLAFFAEYAPADNPYAGAFKAELELLGRHSDSYLFHEHLEDFNEPVYFHQFAERADRHGLQFLAEAEFSAMQAGGFPPEAGKALAGFTHDPLRTEQYMDILRNRRFRQSLLCRKEIALERNLAPQSIMGFEIASAAQPLSPGKFQMPNGATFASTDTLIGSAFSHLSEIWPQSVSFEGLVTAAGIPSPHIQTLAAQLLEGYARGFVVLRSRKAPFVTAVSERPLVSALARHQARTGDPVVNQLHESGLLDDFDRHMLQLLDGTNDRNAMVDRLVKLVENGVLRSSSPGSEALRRNLALAVDDNLGHFAKLALLLG